MVHVQVLEKRSLKSMGNVRSAVREKALQLIRKSYQEGIFVQISSGYRSLEDQAKLYGKGRPSYVWRGHPYGGSGTIVTHAKPGQSVHNDGRAIDYFLVSPDGERGIWVVNQSWRRVAEIAKSQGFEWGGDWKTFVDYCHLELNKGDAVLDEKKTNPSTEQMLKKGSTGKEVEEIQQQLVQIGYPLTQYGVDRYFGSETERMVRKFQEDRGLIVDGVVGPVTRREFEKSLVSSDSPYPGKPLRRGSSGIPVKAVQRKLGILIDGHYGEGTETAVRKFQRENQLAVDGITGPETWNRLF